MRLNELHVQGFRNLQEVHLADLSQHSHFFYGENAQGKTSLLEAIHLMTAVRSFRTIKPTDLIEHQSQQSILQYHLLHDLEDETSARIDLHRKGKKEIQQDGEPVKRFQNFIGKFPTVIFSSQDIQLLRGGPSNRRKYIDLHFSSIDSQYFDTLRKYHQALKQRNEILKQSSPSLAMIAPFNRIIATYAHQLNELRKRYLSELEPLFKQAYNIISAERDQVSISLKSQNAHTEEDWNRLYEEQFASDQRFQSTRHGPHRDDIICTIEGRPSDQFGSEGQQRSIVLSLRLAQVSHWIQKKKVSPIVLADDILGELDSTRASNFWNAIPHDIQIFATGTSIPQRTSSPNWNLWKIQNGQVQRK